ncbi:uncharacterized protein LOC125321162 [Corvus hawaiiensis]|uniref:uncharacterized protein LOC125321162 n=1 Tax=Corvus hawaiiensis TaxID=134902 RepID=UPI002018B126|nr:uncharacterized protein LOC125321162 [Corvus hawaiiensis]
MAERGPGIGRRARRSPARPGGSAAWGMRTARRGLAGAGGDAAGAGRSAGGAWRRDAGAARGRGHPEGEWALRGRGRSAPAGAEGSAGGVGAEVVESSVGFARSGGVILKTRSWCAFGLVVWFGFFWGAGDAPVRARSCLRGAARPPVVRVGPGAERWPWGRRLALRRFGGKRLPRPAFARFGLIFNTCPFIYNSGCSDSSPVSAPIYACTPFSFPFPKGQPRHSPREGESYSAGLGFVCLNIELEKIPPLCGLINNKSDRFAFPINDTDRRTLLHRARQARYAAEGRQGD